MTTAESDNNSLYHVDATKKVSYADAKDAFGVGVVGGTGVVSTVPSGVESKSGTETAIMVSNSEEYTYDRMSATIGEGCTDS